MPGVPGIDRLVMNIVGDTAVMVQGLISGDFDAVHSVTSQDIPMLQANPDVRLQRGLTALVEVLAMNTAREPLSDVAFRQAVAMAIDKESVMEIAYGGGPIVGSFMDYGNSYYVDFTAMWPYDPEAARDRLATSSYAGQRLVMKVPENFDAHVTAAQMYQEMLKKIGVNVDLQLVDWSTWLGEVYRGDRDYDFTVIGHTGKLDPSGRLGVRADTAMGSGTSYVQWVNATAATAIAEAAVVSDTAKRRRLYAIALEEMAREVPHVYVGSNYRYLATRSNVTGLRQDTSLDTFDFRFVQIGN
jgi:peptide/nickel transport system substrate-binding protein